MRKDTHASLTQGDGVLGLGITSSGAVSIDQLRHYAAQAGKYMNQA
jgi:hypothetical protein